MTADLPLPTNVHLYLSAASPLFLLLLIVDMSACLHVILSRRALLRLLWVAPVRDENPKQKAKTHTRAYTQRVCRGG